VRILDVVRLSTASGVELTKGSGSLAGGGGRLGVRHYSEGIDDADTIDGARTLVRGLVGILTVHRGLMGCDGALSWRGSGGATELAAGEPESPPVTLELRRDWGRKPREDVVTEEVIRARRGELDPDRKPGPSDPAATLADLDDRPSHRHRTLPAVDPAGDLSIPGRSCVNLDQGTAHAEILQPSLEDFACAPS
jgi:hypothetical protein